MIRLCEFIFFILVLTGGLLLGSDGQQISRTLLSILADLNNAVI